jgi:RNA polymerase sigma-70 factor (ECF subfamily)
MSDSGLENAAYNGQLADLTQQNPALPEEQLLQAWIARIVDSDQSALGLLYESLLGQVYGLALRITRQVPLAEEVVQDTFWQVWRQAPRFDPERGHAKAWVLTIARSRALDALRQLEPCESGLEPDMLALTAVPDNELPPDLLAAVQQGQQLQIALANLDALPRQLVSLAFFRGLSHDEIAEYSGLPLGTVKSHIRRALLALRQLLADDATEVIDT